MRISARNQLPGTVVSVEKGAVNGVVKIEVAPGVRGEEGGRRRQGLLRHGGPAGLRPYAAARRRSARPSVRSWQGRSLAQNLLNLPPDRRYRG